jgi:hypothetical protein
MSLAVSPIMLGVPPLRGSHVWILIPSLLETPAMSDHPRVHLYVLGGNRYQILVDSTNSSFGTIWECLTCENQSKIESSFATLDEALTAGVLAINEHNQQVHSKPQS